MKFVRRSAFGWPPTRATRANPRRGLVIHYDGANQGLAGKPHSACVAYWKRTRTFHMRSRGWVDIGYSFAACPHGYVFEGRGLNRTQAAQPGGNTTWYSCTLMSGPSERPNSAQINAVRELRQWLMGKGVAGAVRGHRDFVSTSCPGNIAYRMVKDGTFRKSPEEDDDVPTYVSVDKTRDSRTETVTAGEWQQIYFNQNNSEGAKRHHADGDWPSLVKGPADYTGTIKLRLTELPKGVEGQARVIEVTQRGDDWRVVERDWPVEFTGTGGDTFVTIPVAGFVSDDRRLRVEVTHFGEGGVRPKVVGGHVRLQVWER